MKRKAFTLIELLVVIAIIALLVSILLPSLQKAKELAKNVICMSNQHSLFMTSVLYAEDNDGYLPPSYTKGTSWLWFRYLKGTIPKVLNEENEDTFFICPSYAETTVFNTKECNYAMNACVAYTYNKAIYQPLKYSQVEMPLDIPLYCDAYDNGHDWYSIGWYGDMEDPPVGKMGYHHDGHMNVVFFDGHADVVEETKGKDLLWWGISQ